MQEKTQPAPGPIGIEQGGDFSGLLPEQKPSFTPVEDMVTPDMRDQVSDALDAKGTGAGATLDFDYAGARGAERGFAPGQLPGRRPTSDGLTSNDEFDANVRKLLADLVAGRGMETNTAEEEALVKQLMQDQIGEGLVEQRARMGRAGFGASGALAAMEGDIQRKAAQGATQETLAIRRQAEQDAIERAMNAIGIDVTKRREGREAAFDEQFLAALQSALAQENAGADSSNFLEDKFNKAEEVLGNLGIGEKGPETGDPLDAAWGFLESQRKNLFPFL